MAFEWEERVRVSLCTADMLLPVILGSMSVSCWAKQMYVCTYIRSKLKNDSKGAMIRPMCSPKIECHSES